MTCSLSWGILLAMEYDKAKPVKDVAKEIAERERREERAQRKRDKRLGELRNPAHDSRIPDDRRE